MKLNLKRTFTAATLTLIATAAFGQDNGLTANIPFGFRAAGTELPAGKYKLGKSPGNLGTQGTMELRNLDNGKTIFLQSRVQITEKSNGKDARFVFHCAEEGCVLETLWTGNGSGMEFPMPPMTAAQRERHETIYLDRFKEK